MSTITRGARGWRQVWRECCVRGYHVYIDVWDASIGEELDCHREPNNAKDPYAVKVVKSGVVVGHLPKKLSRIYSLFIAVEGTDDDRGPAGSGSSALRRGKTVM